MVQKGLIYWATNYHVWHGDRIYSAYYAVRKPWSRKYAHIMDKQRDWQPSGVEDTERLNQIGWGTISAYNPPLMWMMQERMPWKQPLKETWRRRGIQ